MPENVAEDVVSRRRFLNRVSLALSGLAGAVVSVPIIAYLLSPLLQPPARPLWRPHYRERSRASADAPAHADHRGRRVRAVVGWLDDRLGLSANIKPLIEHPVPPTGWDYTIGSATLIAFTVQVVTGVA